MVKDSRKIIPDEDIAEIQKENLAFTCSPQLIGLILLKAGLIGRIYIPKP